MTLVLDSGAVTTLAKNSSRTAQLRLKYGWPALVPSVVLIESLTGDHRRDHGVNRFLRGCHVVPVEEQVAREAARLRTLTGRADSITAVDGIVAALAAGRPDPVVVTGDPDDLAALAGHATRPVTIIAV